MAAVSSGRLSQSGMWCLIAHYGTMLHAQLGMAFLISRQVQIFGPTSLITTLHIIANLSFVQPPQNGGGHVPYPPVD
jgi:hypothetical protein